MSRYFKLLSTSIVILSVLLISSARVEAQNSNVSAVGKQIFTHQWKPGDARSPNGDGLGPVFNGESCVHCHFQGGIGGGGDLHFNIDLLTVNATTQNDKNRLIKVHPGFEGEDGKTKSTIVLHRFGLDQAYSTIRARTLVFDGAVAKTDEQLDQLQRVTTNQPLQMVSLHSKIRGVRSQRNSTALYGAGLIDGITNEQLIRETFPVKSRNVSGRVPVLAIKPQMKLGRFGWRGQTASLTDFVVDACATELGLGTRTRDQSADPRKPNYRAPGVDLTDQGIVALVQFVRELPRPEQILPNDPVMLERVNRGQKAFAEIGCADCHVPDRAGIRDVYSDLLLHDMGQVLVDPVVAPQFQEPEPESTEKPTRFMVTKTGVVIKKKTEFSKRNPKPQTRKKLDSGTIDSYGGGSRVTELPIPESPGQEWRTPPLWGVYSSAPYMHDGRAKTLLDAIAAHGGEAQDSTTAFLRLPLQDRMKLIEFLKTLKAPE